MKYTDSKNNITFENVLKLGSHLASGPLGLNGKYSTEGGNLKKINEELIAYNAVDINWNGANVGDGIRINTTGDLLRWIKDISRPGTKISISSDGYWIINDVKSNMKVSGNNGITPRIDPNPPYHWFIGTTDTGISAKGTVTWEDLRTHVSVSNTVTSTTEGAYEIGSIIINGEVNPIYGRDTIGEKGTNTKIKEIITGTINYTPFITENTLNSYRIGVLQVGDNKEFTLYGLYAPDSGDNSSGNSNSSITETRIKEIIANNFSYYQNVKSTDLNVYPIGTITLAGKSVTFYGRYPSGTGEGGGEGGGTSYIENPYDPQPLINRIDELESYINSLKEQLEAIHKSNLEDIDAAVANILKEWAAFKGNIGYVGTNGWVWSDALNGYISQLGYINSKTDGTWTNIIQTVRSLEQRVNGLTFNEDGTVNLTQAFVDSCIDRKVNGEYIARLMAGTSYMLVENDSEDAETLRWLMSKLQSESSKEESFIRLVSDASSGEIASIQTMIETIDGKVTSVQASMTNMFGENIGGVYTKADFESVITGLFSSNGTATASIMTSISENKTVVDTISAAAYGKVEAGIHALKYLVFPETGKIKYKHTSDGRIDAIQGSDGIPMLEENVGASIVASINADTNESNVTIKADKIDINGVVTKLTANEAFINNLTSNTAFINKLKSTKISIASSLLAGDIDKQGCSIEPLADNVAIRFGKITSDVYGNLNLYNENTLLKLSSAVIFDSYNTGQINIRRLDPNNNNKEVGNLIIDSEGVVIFDKNNPDYNEIGAIYNKDGLYLYKSSSSEGVFISGGRKINLFPNICVRLLSNEKVYIDPTQFYIENSVGKTKIYPGSIVLSDSIYNVELTAEDVRKLKRLIN